MENPDRPDAAAGARPLVLIEGWEEGLDRTVARLRREGWWVTVDGFALPVPGPRAVVAGVVADAGGAARAVLAAARGAGVVADCRAPAGVTDRLHDDLARIGPVTEL